MDWGSPIPARLQGWPVTGALAGGSLVPVVPWRAVGDVMSGLAGYLDVLAIVLIAVQSVLGSEAVGLTLAWLLIGWLTYQYTHLLYPSEFETVVDFTGFRALTAIGTLYFGVAVWGLIAPAAVPVQVLTASPTSESSVMGLLLISGILGGGIVFGVYFVRWHPKELYAEESNLTSSFQTFVQDPVELDTFPDRWQTFVRWGEASAYATLPSIMCLFTGFVGIVLNLFYPIPEAVFVVGLVALRVSERVGTQTVRVPDYEVDLRLLDSLSGAVQNIKGTVMIFFSFIGVSISGMVFFVVSSTLIESVSGGGTPRVVVVASDQVWLVALGNLFLVMLLSAHLLMGVYSVVHWIRQFERIGPYARRWEGPEWTDEASLVTRPPGLLLPTHLPPLGVLSAAVIGTATGSTLMRLSVGIGGMTVAIVVMGWSLVRTRRYDPQPLTHESRDLLITLLLLMAVGSLLVAVDSNTLQINTEPALIVGGSGLLMTGLYYIPDISYWTLGQRWTRKLLLMSYCLLLAIFTIILLRLGSEGSTLVAEIIMIAVAVMIISITLIDIFLDYIE